MNIGVNEMRWDGMEWQVIIAGLIMLFIFLMLVLIYALKITFERG